MSLDELEARHDALLIAAGAEHPRDPGMPGQDLAGCHYAMPFPRAAEPAYRRRGRLARAAAARLGKHVVVIGGGDTASDCVGTSFRQGALSVTQLDIRQMPPAKEDKLTVWPFWPTKFRTSSSQAEGAEREFACATLEIVGNARGKVTGVRCARVDARRVPIPGSEFVIKADLVLIAIGFSGPMEGTYLAGSGETLARDRRGNVLADTESYRTSRPKVFTAGDCRRGQSLVVWAIREGPRPHGRSTRR